MKTVCHDRFHFESLFSKKVTAGFDGGRITSDAGVLLLRELDMRHKVTDHITWAIHNPRAAHRIRHSYDTLVRPLLYNITLGYEDTNDASCLRHDPALKNSL